MEASWFRIDKYSGKLIQNKHFKNSYAEKVCRHNHILKQRLSTLNQHFESGKNVK